MMHGSGCPVQPPTDRPTGQRTWCRAPEVPDLCSQCTVPGTTVHRPALGYVQARGDRLGVCAGCLADWQATGHLVVLTDRGG